jgi:hypothetical protein
VRTQHQFRFANWHKYVNTQGVEPDRLKQFDRSCHVEESSNLGLASDLDLIELGLRQSSGTYAQTCRKVQVANGRFLEN